MPWSPQRPLRWRHTPRGTPGLFLQQDGQGGQLYRGAAPAPGHHHGVACHRVPRCHATGRAGSSQIAPTKACLNPVAGIVPALVGYPVGIGLTMESTGSSGMTRPMTKGQREGSATSPAPSRPAHRSTELAAQRGARTRCAPWQSQGQGHVNLSPCCLYSDSLLIETLECAIRASPKVRRRHQVGTPQALVTRLRSACHSAMARRTQWGLMP